MTFYRFPLFNPRNAPKPWKLCSESSMPIAIIFMMAKTTFKTWICSLNNFPSRLTPWSEKRILWTSNWKNDIIAFRIWTVTTLREEEFESKDTCSKGTKKALLNLGVGVGFIWRITSCVIQKEAVKTSQSWRRIYVFASSDHLLTLKGDFALRSFHQRSLIFCR